MNIDQLPKEYKDVVMKLYGNSNSFLVQYPEPRPNNAHRWFFVLHTRSTQSEVISDNIGKMLAADGWVAPELSDEEYQIQIALGSIDCRVYRLVPAKPKDVKEII